MRLMSSPRHTIATNKKALHDYEILAEYDAGIVLSGSEVQSIRGGHVNLKGSYVTAHQGRLILIGCHISPYRHHSGVTLDPKRERMLLMHKKEILTLERQISEAGCTLIATAIMTVGNLIKVRIALARGRKKWQKKQLLKERDIARETALKWKY